MKSRRVLMTGTIAISLLVVFSGQACPPNGDGMLPAPAPIPGSPGDQGPPGEMGLPGEPGTDATVIAGDGVNLANGVVSLDTNFTDGLYWKLDGNAGTTAGTHFLGTTDNQPLELHVNGTRALRLEPTTGAPNLIGGASDNTVDAGVKAATIAGGGPSDLNDPATGNHVFDDHGTIGGGGNNKVGIDDGDTTTQAFATIGGGLDNSAIGENSNVSGGEGNTASGGESTVGGGINNTASGVHATIGGGSGNAASDLRATVGGGGANTASGDRATVGGGDNNTASKSFATVSGGDTNTANDFWATVGGGLRNTASGGSSTVGGGFGNDAMADYTTIAGGGRTVSNDLNTNNQVFDDYGTIGGGGNNKVGIDDGFATAQAFATIGGGHDNIASGLNSTVGGGQANNADSLSTVAGGKLNTAIGGSSTVGGGLENQATGASSTVGGGFRNTANGAGSTVSGGSDNSAAGFTATVTGGIGNEAAGRGSFAAGTRAKATEDGSFVWGDNTDADVGSSGVNSFVVRAGGGTVFFSSSDQTTGVVLFAGDGAWSDISDRNVKENFEQVDSREILERLAAIPIDTWNYKAQDDAIRHIGPMAQDFHGAFGMGHDDKHISTIDASGVALAAIQGLHHLVQEKDAAISIQNRRIEKLEARLAAIEALVANTKGISKQ